MTCSRSVLALGWLGFLVLLWLPLTVVALGIVGVAACGGDGGTPYYDPDSPQGFYCEGAGDYFDWGEPGALAALPFAAPIVLAGAVGLAGVRRRSPRFLVVAGAILLSLPLLHVLAALALPG
jgi:hypothetical protein